MPFFTGLLLPASYVCLSDEDGTEVCPILADTLPHASSAKCTRNRETCLSENSLCMCVGVCVSLLAGGPRQLRPKPVS